MRLSLLLSIAAIGAAALVGAQELPKPKNALLAKVFEKGATVTYQGERTVSVRRRNELHKYHEVISKKGPNIKIKFFGSEDINGQIIVENAQKRWHYIPNRKEIRESPARQEESLMFLIGPMMMGGGQSGSNLSEGDRRREGQRAEGTVRGQRLEPRYAENDGGTIAGRTTRLLTMSDSSSKRTLMKLWIDPVHAVILKREAYGPNEEIIGGFVFKSISFQPKFSATTFSPISVPGATRVTVEDILRSEAKKLNMKPFRLQGDKEYQLLSARGFTQGKAKFLVLVYTNGRSRLTLFQVKGEFDPKRFKSEAGGRFNTETWPGSGVTFALVGNLEQAQLKALAKKVKA